MRYLTIKKRIIVFFLLFSSFLVYSQKVNIDSLEQILKTEIDRETKVNTLIAISKEYRFADPIKEKDYIDQALQAAKGKEDLEVIIYRRLAPNLMRSKQLDSAMSIAQTLLPYYQENSDKGGLIFCYMLMGHVMKDRQEFEMSCNFYKKGIEFSEEDNLEKAGLYYSIGAVLENLGKHKEALENNFRALKIAEQFSNNKFLGGIKNNIGNLYFNQKEFQKAIEYYKEAVKISQTGGNNIAVTTFRIGLANAYLAIDKEEEALKNYEEVLAFSEQINYAPYILMAKCYLAYYYAKKKSNKCEPLLTELDTLVSQMDVSGQMQYYRAKIYFYKNREQYKSAIEIAENFREFSIKVKDETQETNALYFLSDLNHKIGNYKEAYDYQVEYKMLNDSTVTQQRIAEIKLKEAQYNFDKEQLAVEKIHQTETAAQRRFNIWATLFAVVLGIISFFLFRVAQSRKKLSSELLEKNKDLAMLNESKTRFFANVSHELKTPLTLIINPLQKLKKLKKLSEDDLYLVKTAEKNSLELFDLTNQILELTKFEVDKVTINNSNLNFSYFLKKTFSDFESLAKSRGIDFQLDYQGDQNLTIQTDEYKLQTILKNLISNALKFTVSDDFVKINVLEKENTLEIQVQDSGRGIHPHDLPHVFDRYFQSKMPKAVSEGGTGIGLAICKEYSKLLGGDILVNSKYGESTLFSLSLPKVVAENQIAVSEVMVPTTSQRNKNKSILVESNNDLPTILLVEDNLEMQEYIQFTLGAYYNIIIAGNGYEGIKTLQAHAHQIQLIISDVMMPVMDGYEFLETIKKDERFAAIPIIMLTALSDTKHKLKGLRMGIDDYLTKPFVEEELIVRIDNLIANADEKQAFQLTEISAAISIAHGDVLKKQFMDQTDEKNSIQDLEWLKNLETTVKENISDSSYTVDKLAVEIAMSRSLVYRKIKALTGLTPNSYINQARYEQARYYLEARKFVNIKTIAYEVGFKDEKYFARNFKKRFGKYPSEFLK